jgi:hypothetical protein
MRFGMMGFAGVLVAISVGVAHPWAPPRVVTASGVGPTIAVGASSMKDGKVQVAIETRGEGFVPYIGFNIHLRWEPGIFQLDSASEDDGPFAGTAAICLGPTPSAGDHDGGGAILSCSLIGSTSTVSSAGLLTTFLLTPKGSGCSQLHLTTIGPPDNADATAGTFTMERDPQVKEQVNAYVQGMVDTTGASCVANQSSSPTPIPAGIDPSQPTSTAIPLDQITPASGSKEAAQPGATIQPGTPGTTTAGTPAPGTTTADTPAPGTTTADTPAPGTTTADTPASGTTTAGTPASGTTTAGTPASGATAAASRTAGVSKTQPSGVSANATNSAGTGAASAANGGGGSNTGMIIAIVAIAVVVVGGAGGGWWYLRRRR